MTEDKNLSKYQQYIQGSNKPWKDRFPSLCENVYCGVSHPPGWNKLVYELCEKLEPIALKDKNFRCHQIKEKFAGLRFYTGPIPEFDKEFVKSAIRNAEIEASKTCQRCGSQDAKIRERAWYATLCENCKDKDAYGRD